MSAIDTLTVVIEADYRGLQTQLTSVIGVFKNLISQTNGLQIDWKKIFTAGASTALFSTIASVFAISVANALQFQSQMQAASLSSNQSFAANSAAMSNSVYGVSAATGESANDVAQALGTIQQVYKDTASAQAVLTAISEQASITNQSVASTAEALVPVFQNWGTAASDVGTNINDIDQAVQIGNIGLSSMETILQDSGVAFNGLGISAGMAALQLAEISKAGTLTGSTLTGVMALITTGIENTASPLNLMLGGVGSVTNLLKSGGIPAVIAAMVTQIQSLGTKAGIVDTTFGLTTDQIKQLGQQSATSIGGATTQANLAAAAAGTLGDRFTANLTPMKELAVAWDSFNADVQKFVMPATLNLLFTSITDIIKPLDQLVGLINQLSTTGLGSTVSSAAKGYEQMGVGGTLSNLGTSANNVINGSTFGLSGLLESLLSTGGSSNASGTPTTTGLAGNVTNNTVNITSTNSTINQAANNLIKTIQNAALVK